MALKGSTNEEKIWNYLTDKGLPATGVAGLMGNLKAESALRPDNLQNSYEKRLGYTDETYTKAVDDGSYSNFVHDAAGYGLAQWTYHTRKAGLLAHAKAVGRSVGDLECQLDFLWQELSKGYTGVLRALQTASSVKAASDVVLTQFERPANMGDAVKNTRAGYGQAYYDRYAGKTGKADATPSKEVSMNTKITTGAQLAAKAVRVAKEYKTLYVMGCFGAPMTAANKKRYTQNHSYNKQAARTAMINAASADTFGFDCVNLIKGLLWGWCGDKSKTYGGAGYNVNGVPDISADQMIQKCVGVTTDFSKIEVGEAVWTNGHIGIYIGDGLAVECTPSWENKVQITACNCSKTGYNRRNWKKHGKLPYVSYTGAAVQNKPAAAAPAPAPSPAPGNTEVVYTVKANDTLSAIARKYGTTYQALAAYNGIANPNVISIGQKIRIPSKATQGGSGKTDWRIGDVVNFTGSTHYASSNAARGVACKGGKAKITGIYTKGKHPYHLIRIAGGGATVYGWVDAGSFTKA